MTIVRPKILVVDDNEANLLALRQLLKRVQADVVEATSGGEALQRALHHEFAVVLMDVCMPDMDGYEVADLLRADPGARNTPIIFLTANYADELHAERGYKSGAVDYIYRPINQTVLLCKLKVFLDLYKARMDARLLGLRNDAILTAAGEGVIGLDGDGRIEFANPAAGRMLGADQERLAGTSIQKYLVERRAGRHRTWQSHRIMRTLRENGGFRSDREVFQRVDGSEFPVEFTVTPVEDEGRLSLQSVLIFQDISRRRELENQLVRLASYDPLTGFANRSQFYVNLADAMARARRNESLMALLFMDVDQFKSVNDTLGHDLGDRLLVSIADRLKSRFREVDKIGRFGGDEFMAILEGVRSATDVDKVAEEVVDLMAPPFHLDGHELFVSISIGSSIFDKSVADVSTLVKRADTAMYRAKMLGRNRHHGYTELLSEEAARTATMRNALHRAVDRSELELVYQPRVDVVSGEILGWEALLRWNHPDLGQLRPSLFIPVAEETGVIGAIGEWVVRAACAQAAAWREQGLWSSDMSIAINLSALQLSQPNLVENVQTALGDFGLTPSALEFELTETSVMQNLRAMNTLERLSDTGLRLAIDDFGTGYSSLSQLRRLPIKTLKIDQSFLRDVAHDNNDAAIVNAIISMADNLNLTVVAEGVEHPEQLEFLRNAGCRQAQGFHFSPPVASDAAALLLKQGYFAAT